MATDEIYIGPHGAYEALRAGNTSSRVVVRDIATSVIHHQRAPVPGVVDNGPLAYPPLINGNQVSRLQSSSLSLVTLGFSANSAGPIRMADDFTLSADAHVTTVTVYSYQTGSSTTSPFTGATLRIWSGLPGTGSVVFGDTTANRMTATSFSGIYRVTETTLTSTARPIMSINATVNQILPAGSYWIDFSVTSPGSNFVPPVTIEGLTGKPLANAMQSVNGGPFAPVSDGGPSSSPQDIPFILYYETFGTE